MRSKKVLTADAFKNVSMHVFSMPIFRASTMLLLIAAFAGFYATIFAYGQNNPNTVDPTFDVQVRTNSFGFLNVSAVTTLPDGKILAGGSFNSYNEQPVGGLIRLNANGTLDATFNNNLIAAGSIITKIVLQPDGKIIIGGNFYTLNNQTAVPPPLMRLNANGTIDSTFNYTVGGAVERYAADPSGRIVASGTFQVNINGNTVNRTLIRLNADGTLDTTFNYTGGVAARFGLQGNKVIIAIDQTGHPVDRLNEDGSPDASFIRINLGDFAHRDLVVQPDNKILTLTDRRLLRLHASGVVDTTFQTTDFPGQARQILLGDDGRITVASPNASGTPGFKFIRVLPNGTLDQSFNPPSYLYVLDGHAVASDGSVIVANQINVLNGTIINGFMRLLPSGIQDASFNPGGTGFQRISPGRVRAIYAAPNGKIYIGGDFDRINGTTRPKLGRLNADGTLDASFQINTSGTDNYFSQFRDVYHIVAQPDGKLLVSGGFIYVLNGTARSNLVRLNADGSIDPTFALGGIVNDLFAVNAAGRNKIALFGDGKIVVGTSRSGTSPNQKFPIKFNADGSLDNSFAPTFYSAENLLYIFDIAVQPDGKILVAGKYASSSNKSFFTRLNGNGTVDPTFQINEESGKEISAFSLLPNGKILIVNGETPASASTQSRVLRLNADGSPDNSFNVGTGANGRITSLLILPSGKALAGGRFTTYNNQPRQNLALLSQDGTLETTAYNVNEEVLTLAADSEGRILVGGVFTSIGVGGQNFNRSYIARLVDSVSRTRFDFDGDGRADLAVFNPTNGGWSILSSQTNHGVPTQFGQNGDRIAPADFDGDGRTDYAVFRPNQGIWYVMQSTAGFTAYTWGASEDKPYPADFDGDGKADIAVWRPSNGIWYILQSTGHHSYYQFGAAGDVPVPADYDGDGKTDVAVWRPSNGTFYWLASASGNHLRGVQFGTLGDIPAVADYNGDGKADLVVFRPSQGIWHQYLTTANGSFAFSSVQFGQAGDEPVAADYDGDGKADIAVRRQGVWHLLRSNQGFTGLAFGGAATQAVAALPNQ